MEHYQPLMVQNSYLKLLQTHEINFEIIIAKNGNNTTIFFVYFLSSELVGHFYLFTQASKGFHKTSCF